MENIKDLVRDIVVSIQLSFNRNGEMIIFYTDRDYYDVCQIVKEVVIYKYSKKQFKFNCFETYGNNGLFYAYSQGRIMFRIQSKRSVDYWPEVDILESHEKNQLDKMGR